MARTCAFCGATPLTTEHVIPQWISRLMIPKDWKVVVDGARVHDGKLRTSRRISRNYDFTAKIVCEGCNGGWMSRLETQAQLLIGPLLQGQPGSLDVQAQTFIATWATKTALVFEYLSHHSQPPLLERRRWLINHLIPPPDTVVWLAAYSGNKAATCVMADQLLTFPINHNDPPDTDQIGMRFVTVSLGPLVFQVLFIVSQRRIALNVPVEYQAHVTPIWPRVAGVRPMVDWPQPFLDDTGLDIFANATLSPMVIHRGETRRAGSLA